MINANNQDIKSACTRPRCLVIFSIAVFLAFATGCSDQPSQPAEQNQGLPGLIGSWQWFKTISGGEISTPLTEKFSLTLVFVDDSTYDEYKNDTWYYTGGYTIDTGLCLSDTAAIVQMDSYTLCPDRSYRFNVRDTLEITDCCEGGKQWFYARIN